MTDKEYYKKRIKVLAFFIYQCAGLIVRAEEKNEEFINRIELMSLLSDMTGTDIKLALDNNKDMFMEDNNETLH